MRNFSIGSFWRIGALALAAALLVACGGGGTKSDALVQPANVPASFDVTLLADKDNQFDYDGAPLTTEDLKSAFRYRQEESLPMSTVLLKRGEKQKVTDEHVIAIARIAFEMKINVFIQEKGGQISEVRAQVKE
jgi:hypothetical protein